MPPGVGMEVNVRESARPPYAREHSGQQGGVESIVNQLSNHCHEVVVELGECGSCSRESDDSGWYKPCRGRSSG